MLPSPNIKSCTSRSQPRLGLGAEGPRRGTLLDAVFPSCHVLQADGQEEPRLAARVGDCASFLHASRTADIQLDDAAGRGAVALAANVQQAIINAKITRLNAQLAKQNLTDQIPLLKEDKDNGAEVIKAIQAAISSESDGTKQQLLQLQQRVEEYRKPKRA